MMKDRKGQALVEFILILPIIVIMIFGMIELGNMIHKKYMLETYIDEVEDLYKNGKYELIDTVAIKNDIDISLNEVGSMVKIVVTKKINLIIPGINIGKLNPYTITTNRSFYKNSNLGVATYE